MTRATDERECSLVYDSDVERRDFIPVLADEDGEPVETGDEVGNGHSLERHHQYSTSEIQLGERTASRE